MSQHGTAYTLGQYNEVMVMVVRALPKALEGTDPKRIITCLQQHGEGLGRALNEALLSQTKEIASTVGPTVLVYPADGEIFELTLDGDAPENDPIKMVRRDGYSKPEKWKHAGKKVVGKQTRHFVLVSVGYCENFIELVGKLVKHGTIPEGQWREAFKAAYPQPDGKGPVGFADSSWVDPSGRADFPYVITDGRSHFFWTDDDFDESWRWLVGVGK